MKKWLRQVHHCWFSQGDKVIDTVDLSLKQQLVEDEGQPRPVSLKGESFVEGSDGQNLIQSNH